MNNLFKQQPFDEVEKEMLIQHLKNYIRNIKDDRKKVNNIKLLEYVMNFVEMFFSNKGSGKSKEEVTRRVLDFCSDSWLDEHIEYILERRLLKNKNIMNKIMFHFQKKNLQVRFNRSL